MINNDYFNFICGIVEGPRVYRELLSYLHSREFVWLIEDDANRASDGIYLRYRYDSMYQYSVPPEPCTVLEMMVALALRCEETIMCDPEYGDRTKQWFWCMIKSLGLWGMTDDCFVPQIASSIIDDFLNREYKRNGKGGLFTITYSHRDLTKIPIWTQMCWWLDNFNDLTINPELVPH